MVPGQTQRASELETAKSTICELITLLNRDSASCNKWSQALGKTGNVPANIGVAVMLGTASLISTEKQSHLQNPKYTNAIQVLLKYEQEDQESSTLLKEVYKLAPELNPEEITDSY